MALSFVRYRLGVCLSTPQPADSRISRNPRIFFASVRNHRFFCVSFAHFSFSTAPEYQPPPLILALYFFARARQTSQTLTARSGVRPHPTHRPDAF